MHIDTKKIDSDLTLEIDQDEITVNEFKTALDHFVGLVREVTRKVSPRRKPEWLIKVYPGSAGIGLSNRAGTALEQDVNVIIDSVIEGIEFLERGEIHRNYNDRAIEHAKNLRSTVDKVNKQAKVRIWRKNEKSQVITGESVYRAEKFLEPAYEDYGTIEGTLELVSGHSGFKISIYDSIDGHEVKCNVSEKLVSLALENFLKRVEIYGKIRYRHNGVPISVSVEQIIPFPDSTDIPSLEEVRGILRAD